MILFGGGTTDGGIHAQPVWPHAKHHNLVNIRAIHLIIAALDSSFQELQNDASFDRVQWSAIEHHMLYYGECECC